jgi:hypothetical protein
MHHPPECSEYFSGAAEFVGKGIGQGNHQVLITELDYRALILCGFLVGGSGKFESGSFPGRRC